jgi:hypothetical protein
MAVTFPSVRISTLELRYILGNLSLIKVFHQPLRSHYSVHATNPAERLGLDIVRKELNSLPDEHYRRLIRQHHEEIVTRSSPIAMRRLHCILDRGR